MAGDGMKRGGFTLIELLIVIGLLGALATLVIPRLSADREQIFDDSIVPAEMMNIRDAFRRFVADCSPSQAFYAALESEAAEKRLEVLWDAGSMRTRNSGFDFLDSWDENRRRGWRGPYLAGMGIDRATGRLHDPLYNKDRDADAADARCYLVVKHDDDLYLLYTGSNDRDDTEPDYHRDPKGDDRILLLAPNVLPVTSESSS